MDNFHFTSHSNTKSILNGDVIDDREIKMMFDGNDLDLLIRENGDFAYERLSKDEIINMISHEPEPTLENLDTVNTGTLLKKLELDFPIKTLTSTNSKKKKKTKKKEKNEKKENKDNKDSKDSKEKKKSKKSKKSKKD
tara:strand:- start:3179 stop:3592 length:414 start_codon:yes stop_codon:yes gene_type:complete